MIFAEYGRVSEEYDLAAFHCQQVVEKSLKAVLVFYDIPPKRFRTHNLGELILALKKGGIDVPDFVENSRHLTDYATTTRYPDDYVPVGREEYEEAYEIAKKVLKWVKEIVQP